MDDQLIATSTIAPYNERWIITEPGVHTIQIRAFDTAGNTSVSERVTITDMEHIVSAVEGKAGTQVAKK